MLKVVFIALVMLAIVCQACNPPKVGNCNIFPADDEWNRDITNDPVDYMSSCYIAKYSGNLKADFSGPYFDGTQTVSAGIPWNQVKGNSIAKVPVEFTADGAVDESDFTSAPIPLTSKIETGSDQHVIAIDTDNCILYEMFSSTAGATSWTCYSNAMFNLNQRNASMFRYPTETSVTSADAAGLPIFPGLVKYSEVASGNITHAVRFTLPTAQRAYVPPAKHYGSTKDATYLPYGARFRLKPSFDLSTYTGQSLVILKALKKYGMIFADQGSSYYISGEPNDNWDSDDLNQLKKVPGTAFEMVRRTGKIVRDWTTATDSCNGQSTELIYSPNYVCNTNNGKTCGTGYYGSNCELFNCSGIVSSSSKVCSSHGSCIAPNNCACQSGYFGSTCDSFNCTGILKTSSKVCSAHGSCTALNQCSCNTGYSGSNCETYNCKGVKYSDASVCSSRGQCIAPDTCKCSGNAYGTNCELVLSASNNGTILSESSTKSNGKNGTVATSQRVNSVESLRTSLLGFLFIISSFFVL